MASPTTSPGEDDLLATIEEGLWELRVQWEWMQQKVQQPMSVEDADHPPHPAAERPEGIALRDHKQQQSSQTRESRCCSTGRGIAQKQEVNQKDAPAKNSSLWAPAELAPRSSVASADPGGEGLLGRKTPSVKKGSSAKKGTSVSKKPLVRKEPRVSKGTSVREKTSVRKKPSVREANERKYTFRTVSHPGPDDVLLRSLKTELLEFIECMLDAVKYTSTITVNEVNKLKTSVESFLKCEIHVQSRGKEKSKMTDSKLKSKNIKHKGSARQTESQQMRKRKTVNLETRDRINQSECYSNGERFSSNGTKTTQDSCICVPKRSQKSNSAVFCKQEREKTYCNNCQDRCCELYTIKNGVPQRTRLVVYCCPCSKNSSHQNQIATCTPGHGEVEHSCPQNWSSIGFSTQRHCIKPFSVHRSFNREEEDNNPKRNGNERTRIGSIQPPVATNTSSEEQSCSCARYNKLLGNCDITKALPTFGNIVTPTLQDNFQMKLLMLDDCIHQITCSCEFLLLQHHNILSAITILCRVPQKSWMSWVDDLLGLVMSCLRSSSGFLCLCWETTVFFNDNWRRLITDSQRVGELNRVENRSDTRDVCAACLGTQDSKQFVPEHESHDICRRYMREQMKVHIWPHRIQNEDCSNECYSLRDQTTNNEHGRGSRGFKFRGREVTEPSRTLEQVNSFGIKQTREGEVNSQTNFFSAGPELWSRINATHERTFINQQGMQSTTRHETDFKETIDFTILHRMGCLFAAALSKAHKIGEKLSQIKKTIDDDTNRRSAAAGNWSTVDARRETLSGSQEDMPCNCKCDQKHERSMASVTLKCVPRGRLPQNQMQEPRGPIYEASRRTTWSSSSSSTQPISHAVRLGRSRKREKNNQKKFKKRGGRCHQSKHRQESTGSKSACNKRSPKKCSHNNGHKNYRGADYAVMIKSCKSARTEEQHSSGTTETIRQEFVEHPQKGGGTNWFSKSDYSTALTQASGRVFCQGSDCDTVVGRDQTEGDEYRHIPQVPQSSSTVFSDVTSLNKFSANNNSDVPWLSPHYAEFQTSISTTIMSVVSSSLQSQNSNSADRSASSSACGFSGTSSSPTSLHTQGIRTGPAQGRLPQPAIDSETPSSEVDRTSGFSFTLSTDESEPTMSPFCDTRFPPRNWLQLKREGEALQGEWRLLAPELLRARFMDQAMDPVPISSHDSDGVRGVLVSFLASVGSSLRGVVGEISLHHQQWGHLGHLTEVAGSEGNREAAMTEGNLVVKEEVQERKTRDCASDPSNGSGVETNTTDRYQELPSQTTYFVVNTDSTSSVSTVDDVGCKQSSPSGQSVRQQDVPHEATELLCVVPANQPPPQTPNLSKKQQQGVDEEKFLRKGASPASRRKQGPSPHKHEETHRWQHSTSSEYRHALAIADALLASHKTIFLKLLLLTNLDSTASLPRLLSQLGGSLLTCLEQGKMLVMARPSLCPETSKSCPKKQPSAASCVLKRQERESGSATGNTAPPAISSEATRNTIHEGKFDAKKRSALLCKAGPTDSSCDRSLDYVVNTPKDLNETKRTFAILEMKPNPTEVNPHYAGHALCYHHSAAMALAHQLAVLLLR